jgi:hypothetical protein
MLFGGVIMGECPRCLASPCLCGHEYRRLSSDKIRRLIDALTEILAAKAQEGISFHGYRFRVESADRADGRWHVLTWLDGVYEGAHRAAWVTEQGVFAHNLQPGTDWERDEVEGGPNLDLPWVELTLGMQAVKGLLPDQPLSVVV